MVPTSSRAGVQDTIKEEPFSERGVPEPCSLNLDLGRTNRRVRKLLMCGGYMLGTWCLDFDQLWDLLPLLTVKAGSSFSLVLRTCAETCRKGFEA